MVEKRLQPYLFCLGALAAHAEHQHEALHAIGVERVSWAYRINRSPERLYFMVPQIIISRLLDNKILLV